MNDTNVSKRLLWPLVGLDAGMVVALCLLAILIFAQTRQYEFLNYDDNGYVSENAHVLSGVTARNLAWSLTAVECSNWHPMTWLSLLVDGQFFGPNPAGYHLVNVGIHAVNGVLLYALLVVLTGARWPSAFTSALFVVHPLHVESVA